MEKTKKKTRALARLILAFQIVTVLLGLYFIFCYIGNDAIINYIKTVAKPSNVRNLEVGKHIDGYYFIKNDDSGQDIRVLQLTDIHMTCGLFTFNIDKMAVDAVVKLVKNTQPDLIILTGDSVYQNLFTMSANNSAQVQAIGALFEGFQIPWAIIYGNHDTEVYGIMSKTEQSRYYESLEYCLFKRGPKNIEGQGNYIIKLLNSDDTLSHALFLMDSNKYVNLKGYDKIHDNQVEWYKREVIKLKEEFGPDARSMLYIHIPLNEYKLVRELYESGSEEVTWIWGENRESNSVPYHEGKMFKAIIDLNSTKGIFCGHDHYNNWSAEYKGVTFTYGMSVDYMAYPFIVNSRNQRGGTVCDYSYDDFEVKSAPQTNGFRVLGE